jgi:CheY-like chemotaxis protein
MNHTGRSSEMIGLNQDLRSQGSAIGIERELRILLVENENETIGNLRQLLEFAGMRIVVASTLAEGVQAAVRQHIDLVISDISLPDETDYELMTAVRLLCGAWGIAITGFNLAEDRTKLHNAGFIEHLRKPVDLNQILESIRRVTAVTSNCP